MLSASKTQALKIKVELEDLKNNMLIIKERKTMIPEKVLGSRKTEGRTRNKQNNRKTLKYCNRYKKKKRKVLWAHSQITSDKIDKTDTRNDVDTEDLNQLSNLKKERFPKSKHKIRRNL